MTDDSGTTPLDEAQIKALLFSQSTKSPYYIVAPRYIFTSAGVSALYRLCHLLNALGEDAYIVLEGGGQLDSKGGSDLRTPVLTQDEADAHFEQDRTPIVVYPETSMANLGGGIVVRYVLNYVGLLGGPTALAPSDLHMAYSANIAHTLPERCLILYMPMSDPAFWIPRGDAARILTCVYAGKYVDFHKKDIPVELTKDAVIISRDKGWSQTRSELRTLFQQSKVFHVFENTALATEAALCGCPVVCHRNEFFTELIAERELGLNGFTYETNDVGLGHARNTVGLFRSDYDKAIAEVPVALRQFIHRTQALAHLRPATRLIVPKSAFLKRAEQVSFQIRRLAISIEEIGWLETFRRGMRGLFRRIAQYR